MARRSHTRESKTKPSGSQTTSSSGDIALPPRHGRASNPVYPDSLPFSPIKKRVYRVRQNQSTTVPASPPPPSDPSLWTLGDHFRALPAELRALIFSHLLVRPLKWKRSHVPTCALAPPYKARWTGNCANCTWHRSADHEWAADNPIFVSPLRSVWAPPQLNPFLCTTCYDKRWRLEPWPRRSAAQECVCATREHLQVMLVCRTWYAEAADVFYTQNTFAFEDPGMLVAFVGSLSERWRDKVTKVSLLKAPGEEEEKGEGEEEGTETEAAIMGRAWAALRMLSCLSKLDLDARFLASEQAVKEMSKKGLRNVRAVKFVIGRAVSGPTAEVKVEGEGPIWGRWCEGTFVKGGFAEEIARAIKGQRREWMEEPMAIERAVRAAKRGLGFDGSRGPY